MDDCTPTTDDYRSMLDAGRRLHEQGWREPYPVDAQLAAWAALVGSIESGYSMTIDDYTNDLYVRLWLDEARPLLTERMRATLDAQLIALDARFVDATASVPGPLPGMPASRWARLPRVLVGELADDVRSMGLSRG